MRLNTRSLIGAILIVAFLPFVLKTCINRSVTRQTNQTEYIRKSAVNYEGEYCADIKYFNPKTETESEYTLLVIVEEDLLTQIKWPNGGWLDTTYFDPVNISIGRAAFTTFDGKQYVITLLNDQNCDLSVDLTDYALQVLTPMEYYRVSKLGISEEERVNIYKAFFKVDSLLQEALNVFITGGNVRATMHEKGVFSAYHIVIIIEYFSEYYVMYGRNLSKVEVGTFVEGFNPLLKDEQQLLFWRNFDNIKKASGAQMKILYKTKSWDKAFEFAGNKYNDIFFEVMELREQLK